MKKKMLGMSQAESRVYPYQRVGEAIWKCDFCDCKNAGVQRFRFDVDTAEQPCRELFVCSESECNSVFDNSVQFFNKNEGRVPLQHVLRTTPTFFEVPFTIRRSNGELDEDWKIPSNWSLAYEFNTLLKLRGEPWWRVILQKDQQVRHTFLHELKELNKEALGDEWDMILSLLPAPAEKPNETFLQFYDESAWMLPNPSDKDLFELRFN